jgi:hypothetical protein
MTTQRFAQSVQLVYERGQNGKRREPLLLPFDVDRRNSTRECAVTRNARRLDDRSEGLDILCRGLAVIEGCLVVRRGLT